ncbi:MAG: translation initiation factor IF-2 [Ruminococcus bromii]|nr:translation initiation factor IF-2 [Ruminococcus bromii]MDY4712016.1 translation initiation factor IF-2 [Ruminococcus bromii]
MIKYKVKDVASDLGVQNKEITEILEKYCGVNKKTMASLDESELDVIFDVMTKKNNVENFDSYFAARNEKLDGEVSKPAKSEKPEKPEKSKNTTDEKSGKKDNNSKKVKDNKENAKPEPAQKTEAPKKEEKQVEIKSEEAVQRKRRVIDTRTSNINVDKYNSKYDDMASDSSKMRNTDNTIKKQKFSNRSQRQKGRRQGRRETEAERLKRIALERKQKPITVQIPDEILVSELALRLKATVAEVVKKAFLMGTMVTATDTIDFDTASLIAMEFHAKVEKEVVVTIEEQLIDDSEDDEANLVGRAPVVVVMGHVDHGKTSILDAIRHANVTAGEAGGITQHIGAYRVMINGKPITFLDTPGHEAFTTMRARGAQVTDIAILVVAADDGIMPQTIEAIHHAKAAGVSVIVAINKMDKDGANPELVKQQLTEHELIPEEWGGDTPCIPVSAKTKEGLDDLLEMVTLVAEMKELKANPDRAAKGTVIEARLDKGRGPVATVLVQNGTLHKGDTIIAGTSVGRVRVMTNDKGERVKEAGPSVPVEITGLDEVPTGGDTFDAVKDERLARTLADQRKSAKKEEVFNAQTKVTLDNLFDQMKLGEVKELQIIVKADVQGSVEAVTQSLVKLSNDEVRVNVIHGAVGAINESDVMLAEASSAIIVGFNVRPDAVAAENAERAGVDMRLYSVIYDCINEIESAMKGMLAPKQREVVLGMAECRNVIKIKSVGTIAGSYVKSGKIQRGGGVRVIRDGIVIAEDKIASLQRFKDAVKEVNEGYECGIGLEKFNDLKEGDMFEVYTIEEYRD